MEGEDRAWFSQRRFRSGDREKGEGDRGAGQHSLGSHGVDRSGC